uniref:Uncharacterized protein n=1 Tax=Takifugu rubripes TaxID=31033 RepID=A0A3B5KE61_TAKRU
MHIISVAGCCFLPLDGPGVCLFVGFGAILVSHGINTPVGLMDLDPEVDPEAEPGVDPEAEPGVDPEVDPEVDPGVDSEAEPEVDVEVDPGVDPEVDSEAEPEVNPEMDPGVDPEVDLEAEPEVDPEVDSEAEPEVNPEAEPEVGVEVDPEVAAEPEVKTGDGVEAAASGLRAEREGAPGVLSEEGPGGAEHVGSSCPDVEEAGSAQLKPVCHAGREQEEQYDRGNKMNNY